MSFVLKVNPSPVAECVQCCTSLANQNLIDTLSACTVGCTPLSQILAAGSSCVIPSEACEIGENLRIFGSSLVNETSIAVCDAGVVSLELASDLETDESSFTLDASDCSACCASATTFDSDYATFWEESNCVSVCQDPASFEGCNGQNTAERLGCAHGYDLRLAGGDSVLWTLGTQSVSCVNGEIQALDVDDESGIPQEVFYGIGAAAALLVLVALVTLSVRPRKPTFGDMPLTRVDEQASNKPNIVSIPGSAEQEHMGKLRKQMTLGDSGTKKGGKSTSFAEKPDLSTLKIIGVGTVSTRFKKMKGMFNKSGKNAGKRSGKRKPYSVAEAKKNGMLTKSYLNIGGGSQDTGLHSHGQDDSQVEEEVDDRLPILIKGSERDEPEDTI